MHIEIREAHKNHSISLSLLSHSLTLSLHDGGWKRGDRQRVVAQFTSDGAVRNDYESAGACFFPVLAPPDPTSPSPTAPGSEIRQLGVVLRLCRLEYSTIGSSTPPQPQVLRRSCKGDGVHGDGEIGIAAVESSVAMAESSDLLLCCLVKPIVCGVTRSSSSYS